MIVDPRLPDPALASRRVYGDLRPRVKPPFRASVVAVAAVGDVRYEVKANRAKSARRWWYIVARMHSEYGTLIDYVTTTSERKARGWIDAINEATATTLSV